MHAQSRQHDEVVVLVLEVSELELVEVMLVQMFHG